MIDQTNNSNEKRRPSAWTRISTDVTIRLSFVAFSILLCIILGPTSALIVVLHVMLLLFVVLVVGRYAKSILKFLWKRIPTPRRPIWLRVLLKVFGILLMFLTVSYAFYAVETKVIFRDSTGMSRVLEEVEAFKNDANDLLKVAQDQEKELIK
jgi:uncharacterized membrane protein